ncbi:hypothetical protein [Aneurinibacillus uraniidurans]|uniref:hypothetical protein n=1 Tax=Aneurinibacillus uraniidurans TaxID=2966586 RepID=UPI003BEF2D49
MFELYSEAAKEESSYAQFMVGYSYLKGTGVEKDYEKGIQLCLKAAEQGDPRTASYGLLI